MTFAQFVKLFIYARFQNREASYLHDCFYLPRIICVDGFNVSLQVNNGNYCESENGYRQFGKEFVSAEFGFTSIHEPMFSKYSENEEDTTGSVGCVPVDLVDVCLTSHGGIDLDATIGGIKW